VKPAVDGAIGGESADARQAARLQRLINEVASLDRAIATWQRRRLGVVERLRREAAGRHG